MCNAEGQILDETSRENEDVVFNEIIDNPALVEEAAEYLTFTSPFPNFMKTMMDSSFLLISYGAKNSLFFWLREYDGVKQNGSLN